MPYYDSMDSNQVLSELRGLLHQGIHRKTWPQICDLLDSSSSQDHSVLLPYIQAHEPNQYEEPGWYMKTWFEILQGEPQWLEGEWLQKVAEEQFETPMALVRSFHGGPLGISPFNHQSMKAFLSHKSLRERLRLLHLQFHFQPGECKTLLELASSLRGLRYLSLSMTGDLSSRTLSPLLPLPGSLKGLNIFQDDYLFRERNLVGLPSFFQGDIGSKLQVLSLRYDRSTPYGANMLFQDLASLKHLTALRSLSVYCNMAPSTSQFFRMLRAPQFAGLEKLGLSVVEERQMRSIARLTRHMPGLRSLTLKRTGHLLETVMGYLVDSHLESLEELHLEGDLLDILEMEYPRNLKKLRIVERNIVLDNEPVRFGLDPRIAASARARRRSRMSEAIYDESHLESLEEFHIQSTQVPAGFVADLIRSGASPNLRVYRHHPMMDEPYDPFRDAYHKLPIVDVSGEQITWEEIDCSYLHRACGLGLGDEDVLAILEAPEICPQLACVEAPLSEDLSSSVLEAIREAPAIPLFEHLKAAVSARDNADPDGPVTGSRTYAGIGWGQR